MPPDLTGVVPGSTTAEASIRLAGALAELGEKHIVLEQPDGRPRNLETRHTDLPGTIASSPAATLRCRDLGILVMVTEDRLVWTAQDPAIAARFRAVLAG